MQLAIGEATNLAVRVLTRHGMSERCAGIVAEHLVDAALSGHEFSSLARLPALAKLVQGRPPAGEIRVVKETASSALIDGGDNIAYAVSVIAIDKAIELCRKSGIAMVSAGNTWFSGRLAYYVERAARQGFIGMHSVQGTARTAPFGGIDAILGTNPIAIAFPSTQEPVIIDITTSATTRPTANRAKAKGEFLPASLAVDSSGQPTVDPDAALKGAFLGWGGHRGYGISLAVQLLGMLAGSEPVIRGTGRSGLFFLVIDPEMVMPRKHYQARVSELKKIINESRPAPGVRRVRTPGEQSLGNRKRATIAGAAAKIEVDDKVYERIQELLT